MSRQCFYSRPIGISFFVCSRFRQFMNATFNVLCLSPIFQIKKDRKAFLLRLFILVTCQPRIGTTKLLPIFKIRLWLNEYAFMTLVCACFRSAQKLLFITYLHIHSGCILKNFFDIFMFYMLIFKLSCNHAMMDIVAIIIPICKPTFNSHKPYK